jgi:EAL domain-containing protein (putative c-di-GMP-specific phosphodiesterase class I)
LVQAADLALYQAKYDEPGTFRFFEATMNERVRARSELARDLRHALDNGGLELYYQPLLNLQLNEVRVMEALLRWNHPLRGLVLPGDFIPIAEENGLIGPIGEWVLRQACAACSTWPQHIRVALNLSAAQIKSRAFVQTVADTLCASGLSPNRLELELTESVLASDVAATLATLRQLRELGVKIVLDDFGTGYSSLNYLRSFPFDKVKVDRCFVRDIDKAADSSLVILRSIVGLARGLGIATTAEGIETEDQLEVVRAEGFDELQGYLISPPRPVSEVARMLPACVISPRVAA